MLPDIVSDAISTKTIIFYLIIVVIIACLASRMHKIQQTRIRCCYSPLIPLVLMTFPLKRAVVCVFNFNTDRERFLTRRATGETGTLRLCLTSMIDHTRQSNGSRSSRMSET